MADFNVRSDSVNVEQIMDQIRSRIREKRGVDYTEQQIRELAAVKLEKVLDPRGVRSDLLQQFLRRSAAPEPDLPNYSFEDSTIYETHRGFIRFMRKLLNPILKLLFNPNPMIQALNIQARRNTMQAEHDSKARATETLLYEVCHNLVVELTRSGIEVKNLKMRIESLASRVEFNERRARALESVVVYKSADDRGTTGAPGSSDAYARPPQQPPHQQPQRAQQPAPAPPPSGGSTPSSPFVPTGAPQQGGPGGEGPGQRSRRRRRRRGRRGGGQPAAVIMGAPASPGGAPPPTPEQGANPPAPQSSGDEGTPPDSTRAAADPPSPPDDDLEG